MLHHRQSGEASARDGLDRHFGGTLCEAEARYLAGNKWAETPEDILWRRAKHRLPLIPAQQAAFANCVETAHQKVA